MFDIQKELAKLPDKPGVYIMKDKNGSVIYVGKAKVLKNRVRQYFQESAAHSPKVEAMVDKIAEFEYIVTDTEFEALILECNLIKDKKPRYNVLLKDDKTYPYIKITVNEEFPRIYMTRRVEEDGARYFGPYPNVQSIRDTINLIKKYSRYGHASVSCPGYRQKQTVPEFPYKAVPRAMYGTGEYGRVPGGGGTYVRSWMEKWMR